MNFNPRHNELVFVWGQFTGKQRSIRNCVGSHLPLIFRMNMRAVMAFNVIEEHSNQDSVEH